MILPKTSMLAIASMALGCVLSGSDSAARSFAGYECPAGDCSAHAAGYRWASEHSIEDASECPRGGTSSFREGCLAFLEDPDRDADVDDEGRPIEQPVAGSLRAVAASKV
jgi:hypothetical protein